MAYDKFMHATLENLMADEKEIPVLSRRIKELREAAGLSRQTLAVKAGLSISIVNKIEQGQGDVKLSSALAIAEALGVTVDELVHEPKRRRKADAD